MADETLEIIITATDKASSVLKGVGSAFKGLGDLGTKALIGAGAAAGVLGAGLIKLASDAAPVEQIRESFNSLTDDMVGGSAAMLKALQDAGSGMVSNTDLMKSFNLAAALVSEDFAKNLPDAMGFVQQAAAATGEDVGFLMDSLVRGVGRLSPMILDNLGIQTDLNAAYQAFADANGIAVDEMTKTEQQAALQAQVMELLGEKYGEMPGLAGTAMQSFASFRTTLTNLKDEIGLALLPVAQSLLDDFILPMVPGVMELVGNIGALLSTIADTGLTSAATGEMLASIFGEEMAASIQNAIFWFMEVKDAVTTFITETVIPFVTEHKDGIIAAFVAIGAAIIAAGIVSAIAAIANPVTLLIAVIGLLAAAWAEDWGGIRTALTEFWNNTAQPILQNLWNWLSVNVPQAIAVLKGFWENTLLPAMQNFWGWVQTTVFPIIQALWDWLATNVPAAIQTLSDFWTGTLLPAITLVWDFINNSIVPLFTALWDLLSVAGTLALTALTGLWQNVLLPALTAVWDFIVQSLQPVFTALSDFITNIIGPAVASFAGSGFLGALKTALDNISTAISGVIDWIGSMITKLGEITLPDWLTPGSPTPFEIGLHGIRKELEMLSMNTLPGFSASLNIGGGGPGGETVNNNYNLTINTSAPTEPILDDFAMLQALAG